MHAWLGLGSNLQHPVVQLHDALNRLNDVDGIGVLETSSFYRTPPWGDTRQSDYINAVARINTSFDPLPLLHELQVIEKKMGRRRTHRRWGPRLIDIDLLLFGDLSIHSTELELPHPRMHQRAFVLLPMFELNARLEIPGRGAVDLLLQELDCSGISRLAV